MSVTKIQFCQYQNIRILLSVTKINCNKTCSYGSQLKGATTPKNPMASLFGIKSFVQFLKKGATSLIVREPTAIEDLSPPPPTYKLLSAVKYLSMFQLV